MLLRDFLSLGPLYLSGLIIIPLVLWFIIVPRYTTLQIRRIGGTRAHVLSTNPLTGMRWLLDAGRKHSQDKLQDFFQDLYKNAPPSSPNCVEISVLGRRRYIITQEPEHIKTILTSKFADFGKGRRFHETWSPFLGDSIFTTDGRLWQDSRGLIRPMFIKEKVSDLLIFEKWTQAMMSKMPASGGTVGMQDLFYRMTLDVTTDFLLGSSVGSLDNPKHEFVHAFTDVQRTQMMYMILYPLKAFIPNGKYLRGIKTIERFMEPYIAQALAMNPEDLEKLSKSDKNCTFLHQIMRYSRNPKVLRDQIMAILLAGRDTTAATLSWCVYELARYPAVYGRLRGEILSTVGESRAPTYADLKRMTYLTHTLNETLRLYPAVPYNLRAALEDSTLPSGVPGRPDIGCLKDDMVVYSTLAMQRRADLYPPVSDTFADPALFSPDRWDHWTPKPWQYVPFNGGPRICVGQNFAMTEMAYCMVRLLQKYDRLEYRGDWSAQCHKAEIVGCPGDGVPVAFHEAEKGDIA
ncbi:cytochrome P450 [Cryphonectria parasitica EP155]|uniref:Cytochrome P450 n=1 Tax=Cryphonectria parasitica (strain ATCC 38755 / EP155) TaxID=660469 RepID=A0A9P5CQK1_CRYP1|nr:cytochrome P450 [Cryphonectria parasitica EP155]KAF3766296.1 cytochrome P450 [Cryphonectria parasitica EP155]